MEHLLEVTRIVEGAVRGNKTKVLAYVDQLVRKLREEGDLKSAQRFVQVVEGATVQEVASAGIGASSRVPVDGESRFALADEERLSPPDVAIVLDSATADRVNEFIRYVQEAERLFAHGVGIAPSMLIYGPPGVGKTELARYTAAQLRLPLLTSRSDSLISSFLGSTAKNLRALFEHASNRPCVLFLDEFDSLAKLRDDQHELGELKRVVVSLLQNMDALSKDTVVIAATNHPHLLDPAVWRRFSYKLNMRYPECEERRRMFLLFLGGFLGDNRDASIFASATQGVSGADIRHICESATREAVLSSREQVDPNDILRGIVRIRLGEAVDFGITDLSQIRRVQELEPRVFTQKRLASLFSASEATISRRLSSGGDDE